MKTLRFILAITFVLSAVILANAQSDEMTQKLALRLVQSASVKPGDVVMINGGKHMIPLMEAVAIEVQKAGGFPNMMLNTDRVTRSFYTDVPEKYLEQEPRFFAEWLKQTNVYIGLPTAEDNKALIEGIPEERFAKASKAGDFFAGLLNSLPVRLVGIEFPTKQDAANFGMDFPAFQKLVMDGVNANYQSISVQGDKLRQMVQNARQIKITSPAGTDITFSPAAGREIYLDDGIITEERAKAKTFAARIASLPAGNVFFAPLETSANGKVVVPRMLCRYAPMNNVSFEFKNGMLQNFKAASNAECYQEAMKPYTGPKERFGTVWFGINSSLRINEQGTANFRPYNAAGMVYIGVGENRVYGGSNNATSGFNFPIVNATVTIDGKTVIKDGKLTF